MLTFSILIVLIFIILLVKSQKLCQITKVIWEGVASRNL